MLHTTSTVHYPVSKEILTLYKTICNYIAITFIQYTFEENQHNLIFQLQLYKYHFKVVIHCLFVKSVKQFLVESLETIIIPLKY